MRVLVSGLPYFGRRLVGALVGFAPQHSFTFFDLVGSRLDRMRFVAAVPFADLVVSLGGVYARHPLLDLAVGLGKRLLMHWQGSDVSAALDGAARGRLVRRYIDHAVHFTEAPWLQEELGALGIRCGLLLYNWAEPSATTTPFERVGGYAYLGQGREEFYGASTVMRLAESHPGIEFHVIGTRGERLLPRPNVHVHGWIPQPAVMALQRSTPILVRMTAHDGYSLCVKQALACGDEVIWTVPHAHCHLARTPADATSIFARVAADLASRGLTRNATGMEYATRHFARERVLATVVERLEDVARG